MDIAAVKADAVGAFNLETLVDAVPGVVRKVRITWMGDDKGRGMLATQALAKGDVFLSVPETHLYCCRHCDDGGEATSDDASGDGDAELTHVQRLCRKLLADRAAAAAEGGGGGSVDKLTSTWLSLLPQGFSSIATWEDVAIAELGTRLRISMAQQLKRELLDEYESVVAAAGGGAAYTLAEYTWAHCVVHTRGFSCQGGWSLIPYADMFNHSADGCDMFEYVDDAHSPRFVFTADKDYAEGDEVLLKYNSNGGWEQLASYGFLDANSANATFPVCVEPLPEVDDAAGGADAPSDLDLLKQKAADTSPRFQLTEAGPSRGAMQALRLRYLSQADYEGLGDCEVLGGQVSLQNEWNCWLYLSMYCKAALRTFASTGAADRATLADEGTELNTRLAVQLRATDRRILTAVLRRAQRMHAALGRQILVLGEDDDAEAAEASPEREATEAAARRLSVEVSLMRKMNVPLKN